MTYPKCSYCANPVLEPYPLCGTCIDVEFCCNVAKDLYGTKRMALTVAKDHSLSEDVIARLSE